VAEVRDAAIPDNVGAVELLWREYLEAANDELESTHGFRLPIEGAIQTGIADVARLHPPDGRLLLAFENETAVGTASLRRIGPTCAEIKRMYVRPTVRRAGIGKAMLDVLISQAISAGYERIRLDSVDFMAAAHRLYRSRGFVDIAPYPESEIPDEYKPHWVFMERTLTSASAR